MNDRSTVLPTLYVLAIGLAPGCVAYLIGLYIAWALPDLFADIAPERLPHALLILATQIWLTSVGIVLAAVGGWYGVLDWYAENRWWIVRKGAFGA